MSPHEIEDKCFDFDTQSENILNQLNEMIEADITLQVSFLLFLFFSNFS